MYVFISHSSRDAASAAEVCRLLEEAGHTCFIAPRDIPSGREYAQEIMLGIERSQAVLLMLSANANGSPHVLREIEHAVSRSLPIVVYKMEEVELTRSMEYFLMTHQWMNQKADDDYSAVVKFIDSLQTDSLQSMMSQSAASETDIQNDDAKSYNLALVLASNEGTAVLITEHIVTMKAYDAASERYNIDNGSDYWTYASKDFTDKNLEVKVRGNNDGMSSNIRTWLNADTQIVKYEGAPPSSFAMSELKNAYENEADFLYGFTDAEKNVIVETQVTNKTNVLSQDSSPATSDKVFLLSLDELKWLEEADVSMFATPTQAAVDQDKTGWYGDFFLDYSIDNYFWWLREPVTDSWDQCYLVSNGFTNDLTRTETVGAEGFGIRPAITIDIQALWELNN